MTDPNHISSNLSYEGKSADASSVLFYSSLKNVDDFVSQEFYLNDINCLRQLGLNVIVTNKISSFLRYSTYEAVLIYFYRKGVLGALIAKMFGKGIYFTGGIDGLASNAKLSTRMLQGLLFKICLILSSRIFIVSNSDLGNVKSLLFGQRKKISLSPHPINLRKLNPSQIQTKKTSTEIIFSTVCWMATVENVKRKGIDKALYLFRAFRDRNPPSCTFFIVGREGLGSMYLKELVDLLGLQDSVVFTGVVSSLEKCQILTRSHYYLQLSSYEGFGVAALEALVLGNLVVHSGAGGLVDTISCFGRKIDIEGVFDFPNRENLNEVFDYSFVEKYYFSHDFERHIRTFSPKARSAAFERALRSRLKNLPLVKR